MLSVDTNVLFAAVQEDDKSHVAASAFVRSLTFRTDVVISEFVLLELYGLVRNASVVSKPLTAGQAVALCSRFRTNRLWQVVSLPPDARQFHDSLWEKLTQPNLARRRAYDVRIGLSLLAFGVDEFATANVRDFEGLGFKRAWNPLIESQADAT